MLCLAALLVLQVRSAESLIEDLRSDQVNVREAATRELLQRGSAVQAALEKAKQDPDPEVAQRSASILLRIDSEIATARLKALEDAACQAKGFRVKFTVGLEKPEVSSQGSGVLLSGAGDKFTLDAVHERNRSGAKISHQVVSDGKEYYTGGVVATIRPGIGAELRRISVRFSASKAGFLFSNPGPDAIRSELYRVSNCRSGAADGEFHTLTYDLKWDSEKVQVKLWYLPGKQTIRKRTLTVQDGLGGFEFLESYEEYDLAPDLRPDAFVLPILK